MISTMSFEAEWAANEDQLVREADSLGELLARMKGLISSLPIDSRGWERLVERSLELPPTLAGFPLWIGFPINESRPAVLLDVSLLRGTQSAAFFAERGRSRETDLSAAHIASLLRETGVEGSPIQRIADNRLLLQYEIDPMRSAQGEPGIFLYPGRSTLTRERIGDFQVAIEAIASAVNWKLNETERQQVEQAYLALEMDARVGAIGVIPIKERSIRLAMLGFMTARDIMAFLERGGWHPERQSAVAAVLERLEACGALSGMQMGVQFDISAAGLEPTLELQIFSANTIYDHTGWFKDKACWTGLIDGLRKECLADPDSLSGLAEQSFGAKPLLGRSGLLLLIQRIHHFTVVLNGDDVEQVNAHVFLLMARWPSSGNSGKLPKQRLPLHGVGQSRE